MLAWFLDWIGRVTVERNRQPGQSCEACRYFIDYRDEEDPEDQFGYCGQLVAELGFDKALKINEYGGHWTHAGSWCQEWKGGEPVWSSAEAQGDTTSNTWTTIVNRKRTSLEQTQAQPLR